MLLSRYEQIDGGGIIADAGAQRIGLLCTRFGQPVHRLDRALHVDMGHTGRRGVTRLHSKRSPTPTLRRMTAMG